ncbi:heavy-metal-associated domain-containing protein [Tenacibaculum sp. 190524A05c]|uniref:HMA domain-containing protein n=1 Tax=Tenacibaculum platacis TaxID=3137852 RepID=A0ABP1EQ58_9FLAO
MKKNLVAILLLLSFVFISCNRIKPEERVLNTSENDGVLVVSIPKAQCANCQKVVEGGLQDLNGVKQSILNLHTKEVSVVYNPTVISSNNLEKKVNELAANIPCK